MEEFSSLIEQNRYADLKRLLEQEPISSILSEWKNLKPLERLVVFKLLPVDKALELYGKLDDSEKYFLFCGLGPQSIAPILENLSDRDRSLFIEIPKNFAEDMMAALLKVRV